MKGLTPQLLVERLALGELPEASAADVRARLAAEPGGLARLEALSSDNAAILGRHAPAAMARAISERARVNAAIAADAGDRGRPRRGMWLSAASGLAVCAVAVWVVAPRAPRPGGGGIDAGTVGVVSAGALENGDGTRDKGLLPGLIVVRQGGQGAEPLRDGARVADRDRLQLKYRAAGRRYAALVSIDGRGAVTLHFPASRDDAGRVDPSGEHALPFAYELDDAPDFERFFFISAHAPLDVGGVMAAAAELAADPGGARRGHLALPDGAIETSILLLKSPTSRPEETP